jgi:hypothetical protein
MTFIGQSHVTVIRAQSIIKVEIFGMSLCEVLDEPEKPKAGEVSRCRTCV